MLIGFIFHSLATSSNNSYFLGKASIELRFWLKMMRWEAAHLLSWCYRADPFVFAVLPSCFWSFQPGCGAFQRHLFAECTLSTAGFPEDPAVSLRQTHYRPLQVAAQLTVYVKFFVILSFLLCVWFYSHLFSLFVPFLVFWKTLRLCMKNRHIIRNISLLQTRLL